MIASGDKMLWISEKIYEKLLLTPEKGGICPISAQSPAPIKLAAPAEWADPPRRGRSWDHIPMASVRVSTASDTDLAARWAARLISRREGAMVMPMAVPAKLLARLWVTCHCERE